jgi:Uma2 family endonuclease
MTTIGLELALRSYAGVWDRHRWEDLPADGNTYEIIDGILYMTTAPSPEHQRIVRQIARVLLAQIDDIGHGETLWSPIGVFMPGCDPVQPDVLVVAATARDTIQARGVFGIPALLVEVLSPFNVTADTQIKRAAYARAGVPEYWIVRPESRDVLICTQPDPALSDYLQTSIAPADGELRSVTLPVQTSVAALFPDHRV